MARPWQLHNVHTKLEHSALREGATSSFGFPVFEAAEKMGTTLASTSCGFSGKTHLGRAPSPCLLPRNHLSRIMSLVNSRESESTDEEGRERLRGFLKRRGVLVSGVSLFTSAVFYGSPIEGSAVVKQGLLAGRIPGLSEPDEEGWRTYRRPDDKSGGHGVGWSPIIPYLFSVPQDWEEVPVSIADLGGTEIDLRFGSSKEGRLSVVVAPVLRFSNDLGDDATIEKIGSPEKVISAFGPEVIGENVDGKVRSMKVSEHSGRTYYQFELEPPHALITATAAGNRLYLFSIIANGLQWKRHSDELKRIADSFRVV